MKMYKSNGIRTRNTDLAPQAGTLDRLATMTDEELGLKLS